MECQSKPFSPAVVDCGVPNSRFVPDDVKQQIVDFLEGRTHGEELLHALHDHVLDEPIPERMLALFREECRTKAEPG